MKTSILPDGVKTNVSLFDASGGPTQSLRQGRDENISFREGVGVRDGGKGPRRSRHSVIVHDDENRHPSVIFP